ncbi:hypothetical protein [uncultured Pelagimonas sp.]|uniref:hypothetical protein n=1 Tax=uncultured Pelagimonas sp. TaxID=1618102 RepID=UPI002631B4E6|nr:hypothetical protein [uncultured Pelagimonas sp.]
MVSITVTVKAAIHPRSERNPIALCIDISNAQEADCAKLHSQNSFRALPSQSGHAEPQKSAAFAVSVAESRLSHVCLGWQAREWLLPIVGFTCCFSQLVVPAPIWTPPWIIIMGEGNG